MKEEEQEHPNNGDIKKDSLLDLAEITLSQTLMLFLFANLRLLSATGRIGTKYEHLSIDSDKVQRDHARGLAGYSKHDFESHGITGAYMMAVFLLEITREADELRKKPKNTNAPEQSSFFEGEEETAGPLFASKDDLETVGNMHALLKVFRNMIASDIAPDISKLKREDIPIRNPTANTRQYRSQESDLQRSNFLPVVVDDDEEESLFDGRFARTRPIVFREATKRHLALQEIAELQNHMFNDATSQGTGMYSKDELRQLLVEAIEERDFTRLSFIKDFFKEGSLSRMLVESKSEMVWLNDWYNNFECTYGISVDKEKKQVILSFRGAFTKTDWNHVWDMKFTSTSNPVLEEYRGRPKNIKLHSGFHKYLFRTRKDTSTTKYDEITSKLAFYCAEVGEGVKVIVTGHSLGAALATVLALYASADERFTRNTALEAVPFGGPYVGGYKFADVVRYQESRGKLRIARFHNTKDGVSHLPPALFYMSKRGALYFCNGIDVRLPMIRKGLCGFMSQPQPILTYKNKKSFLKSWWRQWKEFYFFNLPLRFWLSPKFHSLDETKKRLELIKLLDDPESSPLVRYSLEELYELRGELSTL
eukprot:CAMPEP_0119020656 /NCGR_PEP_ID=MMETSP1176-20130426/24484_1 /TAXON_ID=265551 /ORGANISM="Synedropsis recta cf, Strain CCMP1620" /LENGTH=592 /DNA_ID=CAMNT_0006975111 /DNA_START=146 /DNA_END=1924 /DNA_ORIENTATION=+